DLRGSLASRSDREEQERRQANRPTEWENESWHLRIPAENHSRAFLRQQHNVRPRDREPLCVRVHHTDLAGVSTRLQLAKRNAETNRYRFRYVVETILDLKRSSFKRFYVSSIKTNGRHHYLRFGCVRLIGFQVNVHVLIPAKHTSHAGDQFQVVLHQRI